MGKFKLKSLFLFCVIFIVACQQVENAEEPKNLIPETKMIDVLTDLLKLDAAESYSSIEFEKREVSTKDLIFKKYKIDSLQFVESSIYYAEDFKVNERIYDSVKQRLEREKKQYDSLVKLEKDSIQESRRKVKAPQKGRLKKKEILQTN
jgi:hypothetical protein